ncbi:hypothetical protein BZA70DRAFT_67517 [Myxozyma melibiosi]|uniref:FAD/NAD(P)-binding domain-containing protein n=1 Tax=Myxozyma melibiosi TaxID=54550 RepID=A0ABR1F155_9ASCO
MTVEDHDSEYMRPFDKVFAKHEGMGKVVKGEVVEVDGEGKVVVVDDGQRISYDVLILASGCTWADPISPPTAKSEIVSYFQSMRANIVSANNVVVLGGGVVGCEFAAEVKDRFPLKSVTVVHNQGLPGSESYDMKLRRGIANVLEKLEVNVLYDSRGEEDAEAGKVVVTPAEEGSSTPAKEIPADAVFKCSIGKPNTKYAPDAWKDSRGVIKVKQTFQLLSDPTIFAIGDINDIIETKQATHASGNTIPVLSANVLAVLKGEEAKKLYTTQLNGVGMVMGRRNAVGVFQLPLVGMRQLPSFAIRKFKGEDMLAGVFNKSLGY